MQQQVTDKLTRVVADCSRIDVARQEEYQNTCLSLEHHLNNRCTVTVSLCFSGSSDE